MSQPNPNFIAAPTVVKATLKALPNGKAIPVHFNPASLVYTVENSSQQQAGDPSRRQFAGKFTGKLTMDLQFDTTDTGSDVRKATSPVAMFMQSSAAANKKNKDSGSNKPAPPVLSFDWGAYHFQGFMESFKETIDFFSADGVPLRALVSIGLARQDNVFDTVPDTPATASASSLVPTSGGGNDPGGGPGGGSGGGPGNGSGTGPGGGPGSNGTSTTALATQGGDPNAARALASANNLENPRFTGGASLEVSGGIQLNAAVGFAASASAGAGIGISGGAGIGVSGGLGLSLTGSAGASVGFGVSGGVGVGVSAGVSLGIGASVSSSSGGQVTLAAGGGALFGSKASAGVPATMGAFAGIEVGRATLSTTAQLDPQRMLPATVGSDVSASAGASFGLGGVALAPTGFSSDVGANSGFSARLMFDGD